MAARSGCSFPLATSRGWERIFQSPAKSCTQVPSARALSIRLEAVFMAKQGEARLDPLTPDERSQRMARVQSKNSKPELLVRSLLHKLGFRFRLHDKELPGCPDLVFPARRKVIFVHGCYWHRHEGCSRCRLPKTRLDFWKPKLEANRARDLKNQAALEGLGWKWLVVWECQVSNARLPLLSETLTHFLQE